MFYNIVYKLVFAAAAFYSYSVLIDSTMKLFYFDRRYSFSKQSKAIDSLQKLKDQTVLDWTVGLSDSPVPQRPPWQDSATYPVHSSSLEGNAVSNIFLCYAQESTKYSVKSCLAK